MMKNPLKGKKILIANVPLDGHFNPLTGLAKHLQHMGCDVRWYTSGVFSDKLNELAITHYPYIKAKEINGHNLADMIPGIQAAPGPEKGRLYLKNLFIDRASEYFEDIKDIYSIFRFDLFLADSMFSALPYVKYQILVPTVAVGVIPLIEDSVDTAPAGRALAPAQNEETRIAYAEMYRQKYSGIAELIELYKSDLKRYDISVKGSFIFDSLIKEADVYLQIGTPNFEYTRTDISSNVRFIGGLLPYKTPRSGLKWYDTRLEKYEKVILVTQGTVEGDVRKLLEPALHAFAGTNVLVVATTGGSGTAKLRAEFKIENVIIEDFIDFDDIMPYVSVFITNGGYGGTMLSISNGVPLITAGVHELKNEIGARISYFGLGVDLKTETPTSNAIYSAAEHIMTHKTYKDSVGKLRDEMSRFNSLELSTQYIEMLLNNYQETR
jgi:UDP:flavonoid glycosyltransferase YjiC (YdhE family)